MEGDKWFSSKPTREIPGENPQALMEWCWGCSETPASHPAPSQVSLPSLWHPRTSPPPPCLDDKRLTICDRVNQHSPNAARAATGKNNNANLCSASGWSLESAAKITGNTATNLTNLSTQTCIYPDFSELWVWVSLDSPKDRFLMQGSPETLVSSYSSSAPRSSGLDTAKLFPSMFSEATKPF